MYVPALAARAVGTSHSIGCRRLLGLDPFNASAIRPHRQRRGANRSAFFGRIDGNGVSFCATLHGESDRHERPTAKSTG